MTPLSLFVSASLPNLFVPLTVLVPTISLPLAVHWLYLLPKYDCRD